MRILIADDHALFRDSLKSLLESRGHEVVGEARNGREAVELGKRLRPEVILMDLAMPELDGIAATRLLKAEAPEVKVVVLTASEDDAPLSAILLLFELTGNYDLILPLMIAAIVSSMVAKRLYPYSIYTEPLERRGVELSWRMEEAALAGLRVQDLVREDAETLLPGATYAEVVERFLGTKRHRLFVVDAAKQLLGFVSLHDIKHALRETESLSVVLAHDLMAPVTTTLGISDRLHRAAEDFARSDFERLPVLAEDGTFRGVVTKRDLLAVYAQEVLGRPAVLSTFVASDQPGQAGTAVELPPDFSLRSVAVTEELAGRTLAECALPQRFAVRVIEIKRPGPAGPEWIVPDATTVVGYGDELVVLGPTKRVEALSAGRFEPLDETSGSDSPR